MNTSDRTPARTRHAGALVGAGVGALLMTAIYSWDLLAVNWLGWLLRLKGMA